MYDKIRKLHFVGIGGIGMSGIAEVLLNLGYQVSGSDMAENASVLRLKNLGADIRVGHTAEQVRSADVVVRSSAITTENPEILEAKRLRIPVARRAEILAELMRMKYGIAIAGTHGKTTTTSMTATLLGEAGMDPTVVNGGVVKAFGSNARLGTGEFLVTEADESDGTFLKLFPTIAVVTNMDPEHMEFYKNFDAVRQAYFNFVEKIPFYGLGVLCFDHPQVAALAGRLEEKRLITYGLTDGADLRAVNLRREGGRTRFEVLLKDPDGEGASRSLGELALPVPGHHNVQNALAAVAVALELEIPWEAIVRGLDRYKGVRRRFDILKESPDRVIIDDYAHHPSEIRATLAAAREAYGTRRIVAIFQPHRYSRVQDLFPEFLTCFGDADLVLVDRIYPAGEAPIPGPLDKGGQTPLVRGIRDKCSVEAQPLPGGENWREALESLLKPGDVTLFLGAGSISHRARDFAAS
ncbi:UDP-N-acetylmuramate--L-alanine ligase [Candidatus Magnetaquicoccaceae bacterium FCR-1]|uniref:UDP-N-acetylmuramate--L-alanine ligase n=1 Tax=Candidatus Magnetaquiglobus chichijimensis TaxID=3141448 RepID=A0ABQ0CBL9_9PROT